MLSCQYCRGSYRGVCRTVHGRKKKNHESQISKFHFPDSSLSKLTSKVFFYPAVAQRKVTKECPKKEFAKSKLNRCVLFVLYNACYAKNKLNRCALLVLKECCAKNKLNNVHSPSCGRVTPGIYVEQM